MQTLRPQTQLVLADAPKEETTSEEDPTQENSEEQAFLEREKSDSLYFRWNALLDYGFRGTRLHYGDQKKFCELYEQDGFDSVKEYIMNIHPPLPHQINANLRVAVWCNCEKLMAEQKYDEIISLMQELPEQDRDFGHLFAGSFYWGDIEKSYELYQRLAGENASLSNFADASLNIYRAENDFDALATLQSLKNTELRAALAAAMLHRISDPWKQSDPLKKIAIDQIKLSQLFLDDCEPLRDNQFKLKGIQSAVNILVKAGKLESDDGRFRETMQSCVSEYFKKLAENNLPLPDMVFHERNMIHIALENGMVDIVAEHTPAYQSLEFRNDLLGHILMYTGSTEQNWNADMSTWTSMDKLLEIAYIDPIRPIKSEYIRMLMVDIGMMKQMVDAGSGYCAVFGDEICKPEYLNAARASEDAFVKGESLAVIAASQALSKDSDQARALVEEAIEQLANIEDATRQNYLKTQIARVYAFLKDEEKFRRWDTEIRNDLKTQNDNTMLQLQFYASFVGLTELSNEIFEQHLSSVTENTIIPQAPYHYPQITDEWDTYQQNCNRLDVLFFKADALRDKEKMLAVFEAMETIASPNRDNHFGRIYKLAPDFAVRKMEARAIALAQNQMPEDSHNGYVFFEHNLNQHVKKSVVKRIFELYLDSVIIEKPEHFNNFLETVGAGFGSGNTLFEKYSVDLSRTRRIFEEAEKLLPEDGNSVMLHDSPKILFIAKCYHEFDEQQKAVKLIEEMLDYIALVYGNESTPNGFPHGQIEAVDVLECFNLMIAWSIFEANPELFEKVTQLHDRILAHVANSQQEQTSITYTQAGRTHVVTEELDINPDGSIDAHVNFRDSGNQYAAYQKAVLIVLEAGENATDAQVRECLDLIVDENDIVEMGDPMEIQAPLLDVLLKHENPGHVKYLVDLLMQTFEKCRETQNGNGQLQSAANLCILLKVIELNGLDDEHYAAMNAKICESIPSDMVDMFQLMGCCIAKRFDLAYEMLESLPEEIQAMARDAIEQWDEEAIADEQPDTE